MVNRKKSFIAVFIAVSFFSSPILAMEITPYKTFIDDLSEWEKKSSWSFWRQAQKYPFMILQKLSFFIRKPANKTILINNLTTKYLSMKEKERNGEIISDIDVKDIKNIWNQLKDLYNYNTEDEIYYPLDCTNLEELEKVRRNKPLSLLAHPDKYGVVNFQKINDLYTYLGDTSRPTKQLDSIIKSIHFTTGVISFRTSLQAIGTSLSLPSILLPQFFTNKAIASYKNDTDKENLEIKRYENAVTKHKTYIKQHETVIKRKECSIRKKQEYIQDLVKIFSTKKSQH